MDIELYYQEEGSGEPFILLHGNGEDGAYFKHQTEPNIKPQELQQITAPTLVICGTKDMIKQKHTELIASSLPNAQLKIIDGTHFIANKNPAEFNRAVDEFLETV